MFWQGTGWHSLLLLQHGLVFFKKEKNYKKKDNKVGSFFFVGKEDFMLSVFAGFLAHVLEESLLRGCFHFLV